MGRRRQYQKVRVLPGLAFYRHHRVLGLGLFPRGRGLAMVRMVRVQVMVR